MKGKICLCLCIKKISYAFMFISLTQYDRYAIFTRDIYIYIYIWYIYDIYYIYMIYIYIYIYDIYDSQIVHHNPCFIYNT